MKGILAVLFFGVILAFNTAPFAHVKSHDLSITYED